MNADQSAGVQAYFGAGLAVAGLFTGQGWAVSAGASMVLGAVSELFHRKPRIAQRQRIQANIVNPSASLPVVYGAQRVGILRTFTETTGLGGSDRRFLWVVGCLSHGPVSGIDEIYLDGVLAVNATGQAVDNGTPQTNFARYVTAWKAFGTDGQAMYHPKTNARTITGNSKRDGQQRYVDFSAAHPYLVGDTVYISGTTGVTDGAYFVQVVESTTRITIGYPGGGLGPFTGLSGTCDYYNPDLPTVISGFWNSLMRGRGVAYVLLRLVYDNTRFPRGLPEITANVRGISVVDPRVAAAGTITTSAVSASGIPNHPTAALVTTSSAHGLTAGDRIRIRGHTATTGLNGTHVVFDVPSATTFRVPTILSLTGSGGTVTKLAYSVTPALCLRDFLTNPIYGAGADDTAELDDAGLGTEATYQEVFVDTPIPNDGSFQNARTVSQIVVTAGTAVATTTTAHSYLVGYRVWITGFSGVAGGALNVTSVVVTAVTATTFSFATGVANGTYPCDSVEVPSDGTEGGKAGAVGTTQPAGRAMALTTEQRYACHGVVDTSRSIPANLQDLLTSCLGLLIYQSGQYRLVTPRVVTPSTFTLSDDTTLGDWDVTLPGIRDMANTVAASFPNAARKSEVDTVDYPAASVGNPYLILDNRQPLRRQIDLPFTATRSAAQRIAMVTLKEARAGILVSVTAFEGALVLQVGDVVPATRDTFGWVAKNFRVIGLEVLQESLVRLLLKEYDATAYTADQNDDQPYTPPSLPPVAVAAPTALVLSPISGGTGGINLNVSWTASTDGTVTKYEVQYKRSADVSYVHAQSSRPDTLAVVLTHLDITSTYDVQVRAVTALGRTSAWLSVAGQSLDLTNARMKDFRRIGVGGFGGAGTYQSIGSASGAGTINPLSYSIASTSVATISIAAHYLKVPLDAGTYTAIAYNSGTTTVSGSADRGVVLYVYANDPTYAGGAVTYFYTPSPQADVMAESMGRYYVGSITVPAAATGTGTGTSGSNRRL